MCASRRRRGGASSHSTPQQVALRCRIILGTLLGEDNVSIAEELGVSRATVQLWRARADEIATAGRLKPPPEADVIATLVAKVLNTERRAVAAG